MSTPIPRERRHTIHFLRYARSYAPVFLDTEVDMTVIADQREAARPDGRTRSWVSYVLYAAGRVLARHRDANAALRGWPRSKLAYSDAVHAKLALDRTLNGTRVVLAGIVPDVDTVGLATIQGTVDHFRDGDPATMDEFAAVRLLHRLPPLLGGLAFRAAVHSGRRPQILGTVAVTSLGHRAVDSFHSNGGTTITLGVGRVVPRPVVRSGRVAVAPVMRLSLAFDHRVIDGAAAADVLDDLVQTLELFPDVETQRQPVAVETDDERR